MKRLLTLGAASLVVGTSLQAESPSQLPGLTVIAPPWPEASLELPGDEPVEQANRTVTRLERQWLEDSGAERLEDLAELVPGGAAGVAHGGLATSLSLRGFALTAPRYNGLPDIQRLYQRDLATVERVDILSGPDAILEGWSSPGGAIRYQGKQPQFEAEHRLGLAVGSGAHGRLTLDSTGPISDTVAYRVVAATQGGTSRPEARAMERQHGLIGLAWRYHPDGLLSIEHEQQSNARPYSFGTVIYADKIHYDQSYSSPYQYSDRRYQRSAIALRHQARPWLSLSADYAEAQVQRDETLIGFWSVLPDGRLSGYYTGYRDDYQQQNLKLQARLDYPTGPWQHQTHLGAEEQRQDIDFSGDQALWDFDANDWAFYLDMDDPDFASVDIEALHRRPRHHFERAKSQGYWLAHRAELPGFVQLTYGHRRNSYQADVDRNGNLAETDNSGDSWQGGITVYLSDRLSLWHHQGLALSPTAGFTLAGDPLPPAESELHESGLRWYPSDNQRIELASFRVKDSTVRSANDPQQPDAVEVAYRRVDGVQARYGLRHRGWGLYLTATSQRSQELDGANAGNHFVGVAARSASGRLSYDLGSAHGHPLQGWWQLAYSGPRYADPANSIRIPSHQRHDAGLAWQQGNARYLLTVRNLFDTRYSAAVTSPTGIYQGQRRHWVLGVSLVL